jgi:hypothetical protein
VHRARLIALAAVVALTLAPAAAGDGLPVLGIDDGSTGVTVPGAASRYVTIASVGGTLVERINRNGGEVLASSLFPGTYTIPAVAYDSSPGGLSANRHTLVLIEPRQGFPRRRTKLLVLHVPSLRYQTTVDLRGDFSFDAVSPDGSRIFLIHYLSANDPTRYEVRSYSLRALRLDPRRIVDPSNPREKMRGNPLSRVSSPDGRWAYTLYDGGGGEPFVHALDTAGVAARCIDLDGLDRSTLWNLRLKLTDGGRSVAVANGPKTVLVVDRSTYAVSAPRPNSRSWWPWIAALGVAALALAAIGVGSARGRPRRGAEQGPALLRAEPAAAEAPRERLSRTALQGGDRDRPAGRDERHRLLRDHRGRGSGGDRRTGSRDSRAGGSLR